MVDDFEERFALLEQMVVKISDILEQLPEEPQEEMELHPEPDLDMLDLHPLSRILRGWW